MRSPLNWYVWWAAFIPKMTHEKRIPLHFVRAGSLLFLSLRSILFMAMLGVELFGDKLRYRCTVRLLICDGMLPNYGLRTFHVWILCSTQISHARYFETLFALIPLSVQFEFNHQIIITHRYCVKFGSIAQRAFGVTSTCAGADIGEQCLGIMAMDYLRFVQSTRCYCKGRRRAFMRP